MQRRDNLVAASRKGTDAFLITITKKGDKRGNKTKRRTWQQKKKGRRGGRSGPNKQPKGTQGPTRGNPSWQQELGRNDWKPNDWKTNDWETHDGRPDHRHPSWEAPKWQMKWKKTEGDKWHQTLKTNERQAASSRNFGLGTAPEITLEPSRNLPESAETWTCCLHRSTLELSTLKTPLAYAVRKKKVRAWSNIWSQFANTWEPKWSRSFRWSKWEEATLKEHKSYDLCVPPPSIHVDQTQPECCAAQFGN